MLTRHPMDYPPPATTPTDYTLCAICLLVASLGCSQSSPIKSATNKRVSERPKVRSSIC
ncbi:hypothetical protein KFK09_020951 [Dendrobium nobile]|uniref:Uncharacterized protein n=1 Tax=Dendrobium nobile TaxID=94219 RepID=A0A8T3AND5_DENNO|nr:hypothetical protein KFK09_020951 [Dendrobium nobile]